MVTGLGLVTALGASATTTWQRLMVGESGLTLQRPFPDLPTVPLGLVGPGPSTVEALLSQAVAAAIADAHLGPPLPDCAVVIGSSRSFQGRWEALAHARHTQGQRPAATSWLAALPHMGAIAAARQIGSIGAVCAPMAACATGLQAIWQGYGLIRRGQCDRALVGAVEAPITPLTLIGFQQLGALASTGCYPFSSEREGLVLGEGAAVLLLESEASCRQRPGVAPYGCILGGGLSTDAYHVTAPDPHQQGSRLALERCLRQSSLRPEQVDYIHTHGTATRLNDAHEAQLITRCLPHLPPVSSTKGATGHTLGASGAIGAAFCLMALRHQTLPPNTGLRGQAIYPALVTRPKPTAVNRTLCFSFGFGGQNAVLALGRC